MKHSKNPVRVKGGRESWEYAKAVADAYAAAPMYDKKAEPAYRALAQSIEKIFKQILSKVDVEFVAGQPYADDKELSEQVKKTGILYISTDFNEHPFFNAEQNLKFRAVHDWFSHIATGAEFSQRGELKAYNAQAKLTPQAALPALFTEVVGQAAYATTYGDFPPQKVAILPGFDYVNVGLGPAAPALKHNPFQPAARAGLLRRMKQDGCETFSDKVRWVEEHMPNIDDPAAFVGALVRGEKNPVDAEYTKPLGEGAFSKAYGKPDKQAAFYAGIDRGPRAVETMTQREVDRYPDMFDSADTAIDASKVVLIEARKLLKSNKRALAYLPEVEPLRIDYSNPKAPELIFRMPFYRPLNKYEEVGFYPPGILALAKLLMDTDRDYSIAENVEDFDLAADSLPAGVRGQAKPIREVLLALGKAAESLPFPLMDFGLDLHPGNIALDPGGHLILLDPVAGLAELSDVEDYWQKAGWPGGPVSGKKLPRKPKR